MRHLVIGSLLLLAACAHRIPVEDVPAAVPAPKLFAIQPVSVPWSGSPQEAFDTVLRGLVERGFDVALKDALSGVLRAERTKLDVYMTHKLERDRIELWNSLNPWEQEGAMRGDLHVRRRVTRRLTLAVAVRPLSVVISPQVESCINVPKHTCEPDEYLTEGEAKLASSILLDLPVARERAEALKLQRYKAVLRQTHPTTWSEEGWQELRWGMGTADVAQLLGLQNLMGGELAEIPMDEFDEGFAHFDLVFETDRTLFNAPLTVRLFFSRSGLREIALEPRGLDKDRAIGWTMSVEQGLDSKYGQRKPKKALWPAGQHTTVFVLTGDPPVIWYRDEAWDQQHQERRARARREEADKKL